MGTGKQQPRGRAATGGRLRSRIDSAREYVALRLAPPVSADDAGICWKVHPGGRWYVDHGGRPAVPEDVVADNIPGAVPGREYHHVLPPDLAPWHVYTARGGHQLMIHAGMRAPAHDPAAFLVLVPVRTVLRAGWRTEDGVIVSPVPCGNGGPVYSPADIER